MIDVKGALKALFAGGATEDQIKAQLSEARADAAISGYQSAGLLSADADTVAAARRLHDANPADLDAVLRAPRVAPAAQDLRPPSGPVDEDPIAALARDKSIDYTAAAVLFQSGGE